VQDYAQVPIPVWSGDGFVEPRVYPDGLPVLDFPNARRWLEGVATLASPELPEPEGSMIVHYFETGRGAGKVVEGPHQDGERLVASFPDYINGEGAETTLYTPVAPFSAKSEQPLLEQVATFRLGVGHIALSNDVRLWHDVSRLEPPVDGSEPRRRSFIVAFHLPRTYQWLQEKYTSGYFSSAPAS
jgi:hypothetical protein